MADLESRRPVRSAGGPPEPVTRQPPPATGTEARPPGLGLIRVFRAVATNGDTTHRATGDPGVDGLRRLMWAEWGWTIAVYHRGPEQSTGAEGCQRRSTRAQVNHIGTAARAFVRLEWHRFATGTGGFEAQQRIIRDAVRRHLEIPLDNLPNHTTA